MPTLADQVIYQIPQPTPPDTGLRAAGVIAINADGTVDLKIDNGFGQSTTDVSHVKPSATATVAQSGTFFYPQGSTGNALQKWTPNLVALGTTTIGSPSFDNGSGFYAVIGPLVFLQASFTAVLGGTASAAGLELAMPFSHNVGNAFYQSCSVTCRDPGGLYYVCATSMNFAVTTPYLAFFPINPNTWTPLGTWRFIVSGVFGLQ